MKTITIKQPWAQFIAEGIKDIENRTWKTNFRGRVLIHASADERLMNIPPNSFLTEKQLDAVFDKRILFHKRNSSLYSAIIGSIEIVDCVINHPSIWAEKTEGVTDINTKEFIPYLKPKPIYNWVLANPVFFTKPIENIKGKLSFWDYPNINI